MAEQEQDPHAGHDHGAQDGHAGHSHGVSADADKRYLTIALVLILGFMAAEVVIGLVAHSLALISDAGHMLTDAGAIILSLVTIRLVARPAQGRMTFGLKRAEILSAQINGATLLVLAGIILFEAVRRLISPPEVTAGLVLAVALMGIAVNLLATWSLSKANRDNLSIEGSFQHILTDLYAFIGTAIAAGVILLTGFDRADAIASVGVALLMLRSAWRLLKSSGHILLEGAPEGLEPEVVGPAMAAHEGVIEIHDLHVWEVSSGFPSLSAHVIVNAGADCHQIRRDIAAELADKFQVEHSTLQVEHESSPELLELDTRLRSA